MSYTLFLAAPKFTRNDEDDEKASLTKQELRDAHDDLYGVSRKYEAVSTKVLSDCVRRLLQEIERTPRNEKAGFVEAETLGAEMTQGEEEMMLFLRAEEFDTVNSARRIMLYWEERVKLFASRAFNPLSIKSLFDDDLDTKNLSMNFMQVLPAKDDFGRTILFFNPKMKTLDYKRENMLRVVWCMVHDVVRNAKDMRSLDMVLVVCFRDVGIEQLDRKFQVQLIACLMNYLPMRLSAVHLCYGPKLLTMLRPVILHYFGRILRQRTTFLSGDHEDVLAQLAEFGISRQVLPACMGGDAPEARLGKP